MGESRRRSWLSCATLVVLFVVLMASPALAANQSVTATSFSTFDASNVTIAPGQKVTWTNPSGASHNVHFEDGLFDVPADPSASWPSPVERTFSQPGTYRYYCEAHGGPGGVGMSGTVVVALPSSSASSPAVSSSTSFSVTYAASGSGTTEVELWVRPPGAGTYSIASTDTTPASPSFTYTATAGDGVYSFYTRARDDAGNYEDPPPTPPDSSTVVQVAVPAVPLPNPLPPAPGAGASLDTTAPQVGITRTRIRVPSNGIVRVGLACPSSEAGGCSGTLALETRSKVRVAKVRKRKVKLGKASFQVGGGKTKTVSIRLSKKNRRLLIRLRKLKVLATVQARDPAGNSDSSRKTLTLTSSR